ncbi:MAG: 2,3-bisphosphoglycerate-independent phosphoglycerate mutase [Oscillospiraceae bacterium]|jgi:2,3-bisphosphoglycerate-independent phosphoglycerate mutase|nr:2,3-bisphosphoglycerate-independent phosphoglycerate mutase [Oscillospiraceae bacterium]
MKYFILVPDGGADWQIPELGGKTPFEAAKMENIQMLAKIGEVGNVQTIPEGVDPGSDAANLAILGYDPKTYLTGRAPLEAAAMGIPMRTGETAFRASLVTLEGDRAYPDRTVKDHSAGDIGDEDAKAAITLIDRELGSETLRFYPGVSYRCLLIATKLDTGEKITPPHDILGRRVGDYLPESPEIRRIMERSAEVLKNSGTAANALWIWGQGKKPALPKLAERYGVTGSMVAAVNLLKGIGRCAGLDCPNVPGATGTLHTDYRAKAESAISAFRTGAELVFLHVEAPDECSHAGDLAGKLESLEKIDREVFLPVYGYLKQSGEPYRILILPDHRTPAALRTHTSEPVPFLLYDSEKTPAPRGDRAFTEAYGALGEPVPSGEALAARLFA